jgi:hypothetical protein
MKIKTHGSSGIRVDSGSVFYTLLLAGAMLLSPGWGVQRTAAGTGFPTVAGDEPSFSIGVFQLTVDPAFAFLFAPSPTYYYPGYSPGGGVLTSPTMYDFSSTTIGVSASHVRNVGTLPYFPPTDPNGVIVGTVAHAPGFPDAINSYSPEYAAIPPAFATAPNGVDEIMTEIESFALTASSSLLQCAPDPRVPTVSSTVKMVFAGPDQIPSLPHNRRSIGMVQQITNGAASDFPAQSFFDIFVEVNLPPVPGNNSLNDFPPASNPVHPGYDPLGGAILYNDANNPLIIVNPDVTSLPPTAVYIHGQTTAVPLRFKFANPPYWNADDVIGYVVLAGHGVFPGGGKSNTCAEAATVLDQTLGPIGSPAPQMPIPWLRPSTLFPTPNSGYGSVVNTVVDGGVTHVLDDTVSFTVPGLGTLYVRDLSLGNLPNPIAPPAVSGSTTYAANTSLLNLQISSDNVNFFPGQASGSLQVLISNTNSPTGSTTVYNTEMLQLNLIGNGPFGPIYIRESPTKQSLGRHTIRSDPRGFRISSFFDVFLELSTDGADWFPANRSIRVQASMPPAVPNSIFVSRDLDVLILNWQNEFTLQSATNVVGPYTDVPGPVLTGPYTTTMNESEKYFRLRQ